MTQVKSVIITKACQDIKDDMVQNSQNLTIEGFQFNEIIYLPHQLQHLTIKNCFLTNCIGIGQITTLSNLDLSNNKIQNISELKLLTNIKKLNLSSNQLSSIHPLANYTFLECLDLTQNKLVLVNEIEQLSNLKEVKVENNYIVNFSPILKHKNFELNWIKKQNPVDVNICMKYLCISQKEAEKILNNNDYLSTQYICKLIIKYLVKINKVKSDNMIQLEIDNDDEISSLNFTDYLGVTDLCINNCDNIIFQNPPQKINSLWICNSKIQNLNGIEKMQLSKLYINNSLISTNIDAIGKINNVSTLELTSCCLFDITWIGKLQNLTELNVSDNKIEDLSALATLYKLCKLNICQNSVQDVSSLSGLILMKVLDISRNRVSSIECLKSLNSLTYFNMSNNNILNIGICAQMSDLQILHLNNNIIADFIPILRIKNFKFTWISEQRDFKLELNERKDVDTKLIQSSKNSSDYLVKMLSKYKPTITNKILQIKNDSELTHLKFTEYFTIDEIIIKVCNNIVFEEQFKTFKLSAIQCKLQKIDGLDAITQLTYLNLSNNELNDVIELNELVNLRTLILSDNKIARIYWISELQLLQELNVNNNKLITVEALSTLQRLKNLYVNGNMIQDFEYLQDLPIYENQKQQWKSQQCTPTFSDYKYFAGINSNDKSVNELIQKIKQNTYDLKQIGLTKSISNSKIMLRDIDDLKSFSFIDKNAQKLTVTTLEIYQCPNVIFEPRPMHLTNLLIKSSQLSKLNGLENMTQLISLDLGSNKLSKVDELQDLINLKKLVLSNNQINKINWIKKLARLEYLNVSNNRILFINDINEIIDKVKDENGKMQQYPGITDLFIEDNVIQDIQKLKKHKNYKLSWLQKQSELTLQDCINYLEGTGQPDQMLENCKLEKEKQIEEKKLYNQKMVQKYKKKKMGDNQLEIANDEEINYFDFADDLGLLKLQIEKSNPDIQFDVVPKKLLMLWIHHNKTSRIQGVEQMTQLGALSFWDNQISDISPLSTLVNLRSLFLNDNEIEDLRSLESLIEITELNIGINVITNIAPLRKLVKLTSLFMSFNQVKDLSPLESCTKLQKLCAAQNKIESVNPLKSLTGMIQLILTENCIEDFSPLSSHPNRSVYQLDKQSKK
ncbi:Conserved_hypothetical protein [Hexamita inflata]|uniref:Uncharacterized protein n=1 Tax=Hexamita inflata TaxID=28002 RepID=A0ABP1HH65_9EUKA